MGRTADLLLQCIQMDELPPIPVLADYFGLFIPNWPHDLFEHPAESNQRISIIYGVYRGLWLLDVTADELDKHFRENTLDHLIHTTYQEKKHVLVERNYTIYLSKFYNTFCNKNIKIGNTYFTDWGDESESD
jgi:hypothetical protein